ncbi:uncharacterized protein LOC123898199 [Trifolium pratense]|nr:uncharacterized protein LOC123898199 [Trifolium pratense]
MREFFSSNSTMNAIVNALPKKKRQQTIESIFHNYSSSSITRRVDAQFPRIIFQTKNKNVITQDFKIGLHVIIHRAEGLDQFADDPSVKNRDYNVVYWIKPDEEIHTKVVEGFVTPEWNQANDFMLENLDDDSFLNVEVQRFNSLDDPGTSSGNVVVGRVKIPLPTVFNRREVRSFPLLRSDEKGCRLEGNILLSMRLKKIEPFRFYDDDDLIFNE